MSRVHQMNGKPFTHSIWCDFGQKGRLEQVGQHTSLQAARGAWRRTYRHWQRNNPEYQFWLQEGNFFSGRNLFFTDKMEFWWSANIIFIHPLILSVAKNKAIDASRVANTHMEAVTIVKGYMDTLISDLQHGQTMMSMPWERTWRSLPKNQMLHELERRTGIWHEGVGTGNASLRDFLGMTTEEYSKFVINPTAFIESL